MQGTEHQTWAEWLATRPEAVRKLAAEFPPLTRIEVSGVPHYVFAYDEADAIIVSPVDPRKNYALAYRARRSVCAAHVRDGSVKLIGKSVYLGGVYTVSQNDAAGRIARAVRFGNGMVVACDAAGRQMPDYQGKFEDVAGKIISDAPEGCVFERFAWGAGFTTVTREEWSR